MFNVHGLLYATAHVLIVSISLSPNQWAAADRVQHDIHLEVLPNSHWISRPLILCKLQAFWSFFCLAGTLTVSLKQFCWFRESWHRCRKLFDWRRIPSCKKLLKAFKWFAIPASMRWVKSFWHFHMWTPPFDRPPFRASIGIYEHMWFANGRCVQIKYSEAEASFRGKIIYFQNAYCWHEIQELVTTDQFTKKIYIYIESPLKSLSSSSHHYMSIIKQSWQISVFHRILALGQFTKNG